MEMKFMWLVVSCKLVEGKIMVGVLFFSFMIEGF